MSQLASTAASSSLPLGEFIYGLCVTAPPALLEIDPLLESAQALALLVPAGQKDLDCNQNSASRYRYADLDEPLSHPATTWPIAAVPIRTEPAVVGWMPST